MSGTHTGYSERYSDRTSGRTSGRNSSQIWGLPRWAWTWLGASLVLHWVTAYFSVGYHSADEQFQILEFLAYKLGIAPAATLSVEFTEKMRPWLQPALFYPVVVFLRDVLSIDNPHVWAVAIRELMSTLGWISLVALLITHREERGFRWMVMLAAGLWFLPSLHSRPSSEVMSGAFFLLAYAVVMRCVREFSHARKGFALGWWALGGALGGLSFESRFQSGFLVMGLVLWLVWRARRMSFAAWASLILGGTAIFGLGRVLDYWGYGEWVLSPYRYVDYNLIRGEVSRYGSQPVWDVYRMSLTEAWPPLGLLLAIGATVAWIARWREPLVWAQVLFFIVHECIGHKELRFFFPLALAAPVLLVWAALVFIRRRKVWPLWTKVVGSILLVDNIVALLALTVVPYARQVQFYGAVWRRVMGPDREIEIVSERRDPFEVLGTPIYFYRPSGYKWTPIATVPGLELRLMGGSFWFFTDTWLPRSEPVTNWVEDHCNVEYRTLPPWVLKLNFGPHGGWVERANIWSLYRCH